jgi:hypothetical protein
MPVVTPNLEAASTETVNAVPWDSVFHGHHLVEVEPVQVLTDPGIPAW